MERWAGKVAVVTGASAGIGAAVAESLVEHGMKVVGLARREYRLKELEKKLSGKRGKFIGRKCDVLVDREIFDNFKWITENVGPVSILINNAGVGRKTSVINGDINEWRRVLNTNLMGAAICTREALKSMQANNIDGHIIDMNSIGGHIVTPFPLQNLYAPSKHGLRAFTETLRKELVAANSKIKVTSMSPGFVDTEIFEVNGFLESGDMASVIRAAPKLSSEDVAEAVIYVLGTAPHVQVTELIIKPVGERV